MPNNIKKLLKGKGLLAELEDCRNEEETIDVLKRENLWGIINYPELEELKESYKNGEIEADGTLSLGQLDEVAGGLPKGELEKRVYSYSSNNFKYVYQRLKKLEGDLQLRNSFINYAFRNDVYENLEKEDINKIAELVEERAATENLEQQVPAAEEFGEADGNKVEKIPTEDKVAKSLIVEESKEEYEKENPENEQEQAKAPAEEPPVKQESEEVEESASVEKAHAENEVESVEKTKETDDVEYKKEAPAKKPMEEVAEKEEVPEEPAKEKNSDNNKEVKAESPVQKETHKELVRLDKEGEKTKNDYNDLFDFEEALITITDEDLESMLGDMGEEVALDKTANEEMFAESEKDISRKMGLAITGVKEFESERFEKYREETVDLSVSLQKLNESIGDSINLAEYYRSKDMYREAAIEYKKVACAYCDSRNLELAMYYFIEASRLFNRINDTDGANGCLALVAYIYSPENWKEIDRELKRTAATKEETRIIYTMICDKHKYLKDIVDFGLTCIEGREDINGDMFCEVAIVCDRLGETELAMKCICLALRKYRDENEKEECYEGVAAMCPKEDRAKFGKYDCYIFQIFNKEEIFCIYNNLIQKRPFAKSIILNSDDAKREEIISSSLPGREDELFETAILAYGIDRLGIAIQCIIALLKVPEYEKKKIYIKLIVASVVLKKSYENFFSELAKIASETEIFDMVRCVGDYDESFVDIARQAPNFRDDSVQNDSYGDMLLEAARLFTALGNKESSLACAFRASNAYSKEEQKSNCYSFIVNEWIVNSPMGSALLRVCMNEIGVGNLERSHPLICLIYENIENVAKDYSDKGGNIQSGKKYVELMCDLVEHYYNELEQTIKYGLCALEQFERSFRTGLSSAALEYGTCCATIASCMKRHKDSGEIDISGLQTLLKNLGASEHAIGKIINKLLILELQ